VILGGGIVKVPEPRKLSSGKWFIQLRLGGESVSISDFDRKKCIREAQAIKAEYLAGKRLVQRCQGAERKTIYEEINTYIENKDNALSPATIRGYRSIQRNRFKSIMEKTFQEIPEKDWQKIVNDEAALCAPKTLKNAWMFLRTVSCQNAKIVLPEISIPSVPPADTAFLQPEEILIFVDQIKSTKVAVGALLALSSLRISEISALRWEDIPKNPKIIRVSGAVVRADKKSWVRKKQNKNVSSTRSVPILIPELSDAIERLRKPFGPVMDYDQDTLRVYVHKACHSAGITDVTIHGLRHSFASLAYHLQMPEKIAMEIGGWKDAATMHKIYTHIARSDIEHYKSAMSDFYKSRENANKNANGRKKC
jgi:integrase